MLAGNLRVIEKALCVCVFCVCTHACMHAYWCGWVGRFMHTYMPACVQNLPPCYCLLH